MASLNSWLPADVMHALGWALIHSLWQSVGLAALAAILMAFSRRSSVRYLVATGALTAMLAAPGATFLVLMKPAAPVLLSANTRPPILAVLAAVPPARATSMPPASTPMKNGAATALDISPKQLSRALLPNFLSSNFLPANALPWLVGAWLFGVALFSLRFVGGFLLLEHRWRRQSSLPGPRILALCHELQRQLGLNRAIRYLECGWLQTPAVIGWIRPIILLPVTALTGLSETQLRAVIAHELAHIRRHDFFVNLLQILVETLLFYHPAIWWLNKRIRAERELCCDEIAVSLTGDRLAYAKTLTLMAQWEEASVLTMAANRGPLSERIFHILGKKPFGAGRHILGLTSSVLFLAGALGAANALFGIAYPIPMAHAKASLPASRIAVDHRTQQVLAAVGPAAKNVSPDQDSGSDAPLANIQAENRVAPSRGMSQPLPNEAPVTSATIAPNDPPTASIQQTLAALVSLSGLNSVAAPQTVAAQSPVPALTCASPSVARKVGLNQVPGSDLMTVPVEINGTTRQFLLDFNTDPTEISEPIVAELHLPQIEKNTGFNAMVGPNSFAQGAPVFDIKGVSTAMDYQARVRVAAFAIGGSAAQNLEFLVANDRDMGKSAPYDGRLTRRAFPQYDIDLDFGGRELGFLTPTSCTDPNQVAYWPHTAVAIVPMSLSSGKMQIQVTIGGHLIDAVIDTGAARTVMRRDVAERVLGLKADTPEMMPAGDLSDGNKMQIYTHNFSQISFAGGVTAFNVPILIQTGSMVRKINRTPVLGSRATFAADPSERIPDLALGMDVLHQLHLYAAFDQNKLYVTSAANKLYALSAE